MELVSECQSYRFNASHAALPSELLKTKGAFINICSTASERSCMRGSLHCRQTWIARYPHSHMPKTEFVAMLSYLMRGNNHHAKCWVGNRSGWLECPRSVSYGDAGGVLA